MVKRCPRGQIGLLLLVIMAVVIALVMSIASRSLSDTALSRQERESSAAFSVAETGIETALNALKNAQGGEVAPGTLNALPVGGNYTVTGNYAVTNSTAFGLFVPEGETAHLDVSGFSGNLVISWTKKVDTFAENIVCTSEGSRTAPAAIEIAAVRGTSVSRSYFNAASCNLSATNKFLNTAVDGDTYRSKIVYNVVAGTTTLRIRPIYAPATVAVASESGSGLSTQLYLIHSKAVGGDAQKEIEVKRGLDAPASIFDFALFTQSTIVK